MKQGKYMKKKGAKNL